MYRLFVFWPDSLIGFKQNALVQVKEESSLKSEVRRRGTSVNPLCAGPGAVPCMNSPMFMALRGCDLNIHRGTTKTQRDSATRSTLHK